MKATATEKMNNRAFVIVRLNAAKRLNGFNGPKTMSDRGYGAGPNAEYRDHRRIIHDRFNFGALRHR
jgi:hypothetical protein